MIRFTILGPVGVTVEGQNVEIPRAQRRALLAYLLVHANRSVAVSQLVDALWDISPPATARQQVFAAVSAIRRALRPAAPDPITSKSGYLLTADTDQLDLLAFGDLVRHADDHVKERDLASAVVALRRALKLWRGVALSGMIAPYVEAARAHLEEQRLAACELLYGLELARGRHREVTADLMALVCAHPLREGPVSHLMLALHRGGRSAEALELYRATRRNFIDELGIEPTGDLVALHARILDNDPHLNHDLDTIAVRAVRGPNHLPHDVSHFVGRGEQLAALDTIAGRVQSPDHRAAAPIAVLSTVTGTAGVGKTALAVRWANASDLRFPDGQLYVDLRGFGATVPLQGYEALALLLQQLGVPAEEVPADEAAAAARYRAMLAHARILVVLDNAASAAQVRSLLPSGAGCMAVVTSRDRLTGLVAIDDAIPVHLDMLSPSEALDLLRATVGEHRVDAEPAAAEALAALCGHLPLALRIAAAVLVSEATLTFGEQLHRLSTADRLAHLSIDGDPDASIGTVLSHSYRRLPTATRRMFRLLGNAPGIDFTSGTAAAAAGCTEAQALDQLETLATAHLMLAETEGRYRFHDLIRDYARDMAANEEIPQALAASTDQVLAWYIAHGYHASVTLIAEPDIPSWVPRDFAGFVDITAAGSWFDNERANLVDALRRTEATSPARCWQVGHVLFMWMDRHALLAGRVELAGIAIRATRACGDDIAEAAMLSALAITFCRLGRPGDAVAHFEHALGIRRRPTSTPRQLIVALLNVGGVLGELRRSTEALVHLEEALAIIDREPACADKLAVVLENLGYAHSRTDTPEKAIPYYERAVADARRIGDDEVIASVTNNLAAVLCDLDRHAEAHPMFDTVLTHARAAHDRRLEAWGLLSRAKSALALGWLTQARTDIENIQQVSADDTLILNAVRELETGISAAEKSAS